MKSAKSLLVLGGAGALGRGVVSRFLSRFTVMSIDYAQNEQAQLNFNLSSEQPLEDQIPAMQKLIEKEMNAEKRGVDSIICTAGGFVAGSGKDNDIFEKWSLMNNKLVKSSLLTYRLSTQYLKPSGICIFTGAHAAFKDTAPTLLAYHTGKVATHNIALNLANSSDLPEGARVITILPEMIRTKANEEAMPNEDWTKHPAPEHISELLYGWVNSRVPPQNGSFAHLKLKNEVCVPDFL